MEIIQSLKHTKWDCKYHIVWIPKYRKKVLYGQLRKYLGEVIRELAQQKESKVWEGHLWGLITNLYTKITAYTLGVYLSKTMATLNP